MITLSPAGRAMVRRRVEAQMRAQINVLRGNLGTLNPTTGLVGGLASAITVYSGNARIRTVAGASVIQVGGGEIDQRTTLISIPITSAMPQRDDLVQVVNDDLADPDLDTRIFRVMEVEGGSLFGDARRMSCTGWYESRYWNKQ